MTERETSDQERPAADTSRAQRREGHTLLAAALANGPYELIDFVLPLWAGAALGLSATQIGVLLAVELAVSVIVRPIAGILADSRDRRHVAAAGALLSALSCVGYALAGHAPVAYAAAAVGGAGGALLWVAARAIVSERLAEDSAVFPRLLKSQETGSWVAFLAGLSLLGVIGFLGVFLACAAACLAAAVILVLSPPGQHRADTPPGAEGRAAAGLAAVGRRLRPMLFAVGMTMMAEAAVGLLLLLRLQRGFGLEVVEVALVFLPGAIVMSAAAEYLHRYVVRFGRTRVLTMASLSSAAFAVGLAVAPNPYVIAALWILSGLAWAAVMPIQQAVIAEASGAQAGRGMGVYESASLVGAFVGALAAGALYDGVNWAAACLAAAATLLAGAVVVPRAVRRLGVIEFPPPAPRPAPRDAERDEAAGPKRDEAAGPTGRPDPATAPQDSDTNTGTPAPPRKRLVELAGHLGLYAAAQAILVFFDLSWIAHLRTDDPLEVLNGTNRELDGLIGIVYAGARIWTVVLIVDVLWTLGRIATEGVRRRSS